MKKLTQFAAITLLVAGLAACTEKDPAPAPAEPTTTAATPVVETEVPAAPTDSTGTTVTTESSATEAPATPPAQQ
jgi:hypothetical protein